MARGAHLVAHTVGRDILKALYSGTNDRKRKYFLAKRNLQVKQVIQAEMEDIKVP